MKGRSGEPLIVTEIGYAPADEVSRRKMAQVFRLLLRPTKIEDRTAMKGEPHKRNHLRFGATGGITER